MSECERSVISSQVEGGTWGFLSFVHRRSGMIIWKAQLKSKNRINNYILDELVKEIRIQPSLEIFIFFLNGLK